MVRKEDKAAIEKCIINLKTIIYEDEIISRSTH
jgi:hypothetical protein